MRYILAIFALCLAGCTTNRGNTEDYEIVTSGQVAVGSMERFRDCVSDSFADRTFGLGINLFNRMQVRGNMWRVELVNSDTGPMLSADIYSDGRYELYRVKTWAAQNRLGDEHQAFAACAKKYQ